MTIELLQQLSLASYLLASLFLLAAAAMFFLLDVPKLLGDVTGTTARKAIEEIRQKNASGGDKAYKPSPVNAARGKLTEKITPSGRLERRESSIGINVETQKFSTEKLAAGAAETTVLPAGSAETTVLPEETRGQTEALSKPAKSGFCVESEAAFAESTEIIE